MKILKRILNWAKKPRCVICGSKNTRIEHTVYNSLEVRCNKCGAGSAK